VATVAAAEALKEDSFDLHVFCANTCIRPPDRAISTYIEVHLGLEGQAYLGAFKIPRCCGETDVVLPSCPSSERVMFENLSDKLERAFKVLKGQGQITEINVAETMKEVRRALLDADVNFKTAKDFTDRVKAKALGANVLTAVSPGQLLIKLAHDELAELMGGRSATINLSGNPTVILMSGLQGSGKTTFSGKLAAYLRKKGRKPLLVACDVYRPAAIDQLETLGKQLDVVVFSDRGNTDPVSIAQKGVAHAKTHGFTVVIIDTAGRLAVDEAMMDEITRVKKAIAPHETLFVVDSMTGQDAVNTAKAFNDRLDIDGVVLTKLDGDTRGGAALSIRSVVDKPIKFIGTGEKMEAIDEFHPERMAGRILGMGDVVSLVERAQEQFDEKQARELQKKIAKDQFGFDDFLEQIQQIKKMGNMKDLMSMIPGVGKALKNLDIPDDAFKHIEAIIRSMTPEERQNPALINGSRRQRIANGSGTNVPEVNKLLKQFEDTRKMMR
jgi:signal recognition particle subunit SRP54